MYASVSQVLFFPANFPNFFWNAVSHIGHKAHKEKRWWWRFIYLYVVDLTKLLLTRTVDSIVEWLGDEWIMNWKGLGRERLCHICGVGNMAQAFSYMTWGKPGQTAVRIVGVPAEMSKRCPEGRSEVSSLIRWGRLIRSMCIGGGRRVCTCNDITI